MRTSKFECRWEEAQSGCLLLPDHDAERGAGEEVRLAELVLQKFQVCGGDIFRVADEQRKDRWLSGDLGDKGGLRPSCGFVLPSRQRMGGKDLLQPHIQGAGRDTLGKHAVHVFQERKQALDGVRLEG